MKSPSHYNIRRSGSIHVAQLCAHPAGELQLQLLVFVSQLLLGTCFDGALVRSGVTELNCGVSSVCFQSYARRFPESMI